MKAINTFSFISLMLIFFGCEKEGPAGPAGPAGADGNANVVSTNVTSSAWVYVNSSWEISFAYPEITQEIINSGAVLVYIKVNESYNQLPLTFYQSQEYSTSIQVSTYNGGVTMFWSDSDLVQPINPGSQTFKIVVIASSVMRQNPNVNYNNYEDVSRAFDLNEKHVVKN